jgi:hypothetical protein
MEECTMDKLAIQRILQFQGIFVLMKDNGKFSAMAPAV